MSSKSCLYLFILYSACSKLLTEPGVNDLILVHLFFSTLNWFLTALQALQIILIGNICMNVDSWTHLKIPRMRL